MGQYYKAVFVEEDRKTIKSYVDPNDFKCGLKLMEHSYIGNIFTTFVFNLMTKKHDFYMGRLIWSGDYADPKKNDSNLYEQCLLNENLRFDGFSDSQHYSRFRFILNHDKKQYVDLKDYQPDEYGFRINPLPLLTADGNDRGGGDYRGKNKKYVGSWAGDLISVESSIKKFPEYTKFEPIFE